MTPESRALQIALRTLKFYAQAKVLFLSTNGSMPDGDGIAYRDDYESEVHIKDDGDKAREALKTINEILKEEK